MKLTPKLSGILCTWLPALTITAMVVSWFQNGNLQFLGDFFPPSNPVQYLSRFSQSWDPNLDFGIFSLFTLFPTPRIILVAFYSGIFLITGSNVAVEFSLVLAILLLAYFGMWYLWAAIRQTSNPSFGQAIAALFFVINPFVTLYIANPVAMIAYAMIPWCLGFTLMGLRRGRTLKYSFLLGSAFTISLVTFPQVAISIIISTGMILIFARQFLRWPATRMKQVVFVLSSFLVTVGLNAYWLALALSRTNLIFQLYSQVRTNSPSLNAQNTVLATTRLLGDWSLLGGYSGRLYLPYSPSYYSDALTVIATSTIPILAFSAIILAPFSKRNVALAAASIVGIILAAGTNPPLGFAYGLILSIPGSSLFRNPPRYFLSVVALGYSILLGCFVNFFVLKSRANASVHRIASLGLILLVLLAIAFASNPMISGEITRSWYVPSMKGYQVPNYYSEASNWLSGNDSDGRIFMLPHTGIYMATLWGYQGGNIYPYLFANPIITSSGGQYSSSSASNLINSVYDEFYANRTTSLGKVLSLLGVSYVVFDRSVDTQFYNLPPPQLTLSLLRDQSDVKLVGLFGDLILYKNMENVSVIKGAYSINILDGTPTNPRSIVKVDNFQNAWQLGPGFSTGTIPPNGSLTFESQRLVVTLPANGEYVFAELYKNISFSPGVKYLVVDAKTSSPTSIALTVNTLHDEAPLYAENPPDQKLLNHYELTSQNYLVYRLDSVNSNATKIRFTVSNRLDTSYSGNLTADFSTLYLANQVGALSDLVDFVQQRSFDPAVDDVTLATFLGPSMMTVLETMNSSSSQSPDLTVRKIDSTGVTIDANASHPFVLTYFTSFDRSFTALVNGGPAFHFQVDGLANGWLIENTGAFTIQISFATQRAFLLGIGITSATIGIVTGLALSDTSARSTIRSVFYKRWGKPSNG